MRKSIRLLCAALLLFPCTLLFAQEKVVSGVVLSDEDGAPLAGANISIKGTQRGTQADDKGTFRVTVTNNDVLIVSSIGFGSREFRVGNNTTLTIRLTKTSSELNEVVVAMDIKRNARELGYSVQKVGGKEIQETQRDNFLNSLQGRVAGLTINSTSGAAGASSSIVLRGFNSMALDNQPLFVIDGVIADNSTVNQTSLTNSGLGLAETSSRDINQTANRNNDYTNRIADINPNDIESITVLKGPEATALYGSQASSGAIIITTKKGKPNGKLLLGYDDAFRFQFINRVPEVQDKYRNGSGGIETQEFKYFGPAYSSNTQLYDNVNNFFKTGFSQTHNVSAEFGKKNATFRVSGSIFDQDGVIPENTFTRYNVRITNSTKITKYVEITPSVSYIRSNNNKAMKGVNGYMLNLLIWPAHFDARDWTDDAGNKKLLFNSAANAELDNPYFSVNNNRSRDETDRYLATMGINITPFSWLTVSGRFGYDTYRTVGYNFYHPLSFILTKGAGGSMDDYYRNYFGYNHTITATAKKKFGKFTTRLLVGTMWQDYKTEMYSVYGTNLVDSVNSSGQMVKNNVVITNEQLQGWIGDSNATRPASRVRLNNARKNLYNYSINRQAAYFAEASIGFEDFIFLSYSHRFETSSIFPKDFRDYNYPAGSLSIILSDMIPGLKNVQFLDYWKLRSSIASTARSSSPYRNQSVFNVVTSSGGGYAYGFDNNNIYLEPEIQKTYEIGTEARFFKNKFNIDITYYNTLCEKQIAEGFRASYATGFVLNTLNVGTTRNQGIEISLGATPVQIQDFDWNIRLNFNKMWNKVISLPANVPEFYISDTWVYLNARGGLVTGGPTTSITAHGYQRNNKGDMLIDPASGLPLADGTFKNRGDRNPDFTLGTLNSFRYKNWTLSFLWDLKVGGDIFNATDMYLTLNGKSKRTLDREVPRVVTGVLKDGKENSANPTPNTIIVNPYNTNLYYGASNMPEEAYIEYNVNWFRLRDLTLNYTLPAAKLKKLKYVKSLGFFLTGNDLILFTNYTGADPAVSGNSAGVRGVGGWGFDYGNLGAPISVNVGLRATF
jgi:TonB-linked SusC/RagA family outer membrane protein